MFTATNQFLAASAALKLDATAAAEGGQSRANKVQLLGVSPGFGPVIGSEVFSNIPPNGVILNEALAAQLRITTGDVVTVRTRCPALSSPFLMSAPARAAATAPPGFA